MLFFLEEKSAKASILSNLVFLRLLQFCQLLGVGFFEMLVLAILFYAIHYGNQ